MCFAIAASVTGGLALVFLIMRVAISDPYSGLIPFSAYSAMYMGLASGILGIVQCATGHCCCGRKDDKSELTESYRMMNYLR